MMRWQSSGQSCINPSMVFPLVLAYGVGVRTEDLDTQAAPVRLHPDTGLRLPARRVRATGDSLRRGGPFARQPNRPSEKRAMSCAVVPVVARSARISPITGANLKPWPEQGEAALVLGAPGRRSIRKWPS